MKATDKLYYSAAELSDMLGISLGYGYRLCKLLNDELKSNGFLTISGRVPRGYFIERWYGMKESGKGNEETAR